LVKILKAQMPRRIDLRGIGPVLSGMSGKPGRQEGEIRYRGQGYAVCKDVKKKGRENSQSANDRINRRMTGAK
jgi:hypothetical protein